MSRGIKNNNPLNIRKSGVQFKGEVTPSGDRSFKQFTTLAYGYRAAFKVLRTYYEKYHLRTIAQIVGRWAPPNENNTRAYIDVVAKRSGIKADARLSFGKEQMVRIVAAMSYVENGTEADMTVVEQGWNLI